jgi:hypothetical protein
VTDVPEPTHEQCNGNVPITLPDGRVGYACWYPQMGGYVSVCLVIPDAGGCFEAYVWHDGSFPFSGDDGPSGGPARIHHCNPDQFVGFGQWVGSLSASADENVAAHPADPYRVAAEAWAAASGADPRWSIQGNHAGLRAAVDAARQPLLAALDAMDREMAKQRFDDGLNATVRAHTGIAELEQRTAIVDITTLGDHSRRQLCNNCGHITETPRRPVDGWDEAAPETGPTPTLPAEQPGAQGPDAGTGRDALSGPGGES